MTTGSVTTGTPLPATGAPSAATVVIGTPSPQAPSMTGTQPVGNSSDYSSSFAGFLSSLSTAAVGAVTGVADKLKYEKAKVLGTVSKAYYQTQSAFYESVGSAAQTAQTVTEKVTGISTTIFIAIALFILAPYFIAWMGRKK